MSKTWKKRTMEILESCKINFPWEMKQRNRATTATDCYAKTACRVFLSFCTFSRASSEEKPQAPTRIRRSVYAGGSFFLAQVLFFARLSEMFSGDAEMFLQMFLLRFVRWPSSSVFLPFLLRGGNNFIQITFFSCCFLGLN